MDGIEFFEQLSVDLSVKSGTRALDMAKVNKYYSLFTNEEHKRFVERIIAKTRYITYDQFCETMIRVIKQLPPKFNLLLPMIYISSEHWIAALFWRYLRSSCVDIVTRAAKVRNNLPIVLIDDCAYSGGNIHVNMEDFLGREERMNNHFYIAVAYAKVSTLERILKDFREIKINIIYGEEIHSFGEKVPEAFLEYDEDNCPVYFDHSIAREASSFPCIYSQGFVPEKNIKLGSLLQNPVGKSHKEKLEQQYKIYKKITGNDFLLTCMKPHRRQTPNIGQIMYYDPGDDNCNRQIKK
jgi:hypothetical protein